MNDPGYIVAANINGTIRYLRARRFGRHYDLRNFRRDKQGCAWLADHKRATIYRVAESAQLRADRYWRRLGAWVEPADHAGPITTRPPERTTR